MEIVDRVKNVLLQPKTDAEVLEKGELTLAFDPERGSFGVWYYGHLFPIDPREYTRRQVKMIECVRQEVGDRLQVSAHARRRSRRAEDRRLTGRQQLASALFQPHPDSPA